MGLHMNDLALWSFEQLWRSYSYLCSPIFFINIRVLTSYTRIFSSEKKNHRVDVVYGSIIQTVYLFFRFAQRISKSHRLWCDDTQSYPFLSSFCVILDWLFNNLSISLSLSLSLLVPLLLWIYGRFRPCLIRGLLACTVSLY